MNRLMVQIASVERTIVSKRDYAPLEIRDVQNLIASTSRYELRKGVSSWSQSVGWRSTKVAGLPRTCRREGGSERVTTSSRKGWWSEVRSRSVRSDNEILHVCI